MRKDVKRFVKKNKDNPPERFVLKGRIFNWGDVAPLVLGEHKDIEEHKDEIQHDLEQTGHEPEDQDLGSRDSQGQE